MSWVEMNMSKEKDLTTDFGYQQVSLRSKPALVEQVFHSVAPKYDLMNDIMSFGLHRLWKHFTLLHANPRPGQTILDTASGTGDLALALADKVGSRGKVIMTDINAAMLQIGRDKLIDHGLVQSVLCIQADAECLPFKSHYFDTTTMAFGLRNVTDKPAALRSLYRVLKPGGKLLVLEFSHPSSPLVSQLYDLYSFHFIPKAGQWVAGDSQSYQYLVESIRMHPNQETLKTMMMECGFEDVIYHNLCNGIVALHIGYKY